MFGLPPQSPLVKEEDGRDALTLPGCCAFHPPLDPVNSSSSVASRHRMGLVWPSAMETHCSGAVRAPLAPPTGVMMPLPGERQREGARQSGDSARPSEAHKAVTGQRWD